MVDSRTYDNDDYRFTLMAYDPSKDMIYGYVVIQEKMYYATAPGRDPLDVTLGAAVEPIDWPMAAITYNQVSGRLIGIAGSSVVNIDIADGSQTKIGAIDSPSEYITGLAYSPCDDGYYYAVSTDAANGIQLLDSSDFSTLSYAKYDGIVGFYNLYCPDLQAVTDAAPGEAEIVNILFGDGALSGSITYRLPSATYGGTPMLGNIEWILEIDGTEYKRGSAPAGGNLTVNVNDLDEGVRTFTLKLSSGGKFGPYLSKSFYVGNDTPCAPASVTITDEAVTWEAVSAGVNAGYVDPAEVTYNVYVNGSRIASGIKETTCAPGLPQGVVIDTYKAEVEAVYAGKTSERASSDDLRFGEPYILPESFAPTAKESKLFTVVDANNDGTTLGFAQMRFGTMGVMDVFMYTAHTRNNANDWLYLPVTRYDDPEAVYEFAMNAMRGSTSPETLEVFLTTAPDGDMASVVGTIVPNVSLTNNPSSSQESIQNYVRGTFTVPSAGDYYVGIHITSARRRDRVIMRDFSVAKVDGITTSCPKAVSALGARAAEKGELKAFVSFSFPTASIDGTGYAADKVLVATVQAAHCEAVTLNGKPGDAVVVDIPALQGDNTVIVTVADGTLSGLPASVPVYVGVEAPGSVGNLTGTVDASGYNVHLAWSAPTKGIDGGYIQPSGINYYLVEYKPDGDSYAWMVTESIGTDVTEYDWSLPEGTPQQLVQLAVIAENFAGRGNSFPVSANVMGKALPLPSSWNFRAEDSFQNPTVNYMPEDVDLIIGDPADEYEYYGTDDNAHALYSMSWYDLTDARFTLPKFSTKGSVNAAVELDVYGGSTSSFSITASAAGIPARTVKTFAAGDFAQKGPQTVTVDLPAEFQDKEWVEIGILYNTTYSWYGESESFILYAYRFFDNIPFDFGVTSIEGPSAANIGEENVYKAHVMNFGSTANPMPSSKWSFTDPDGNVVTEVSVAAGTDNVAPGDEAVLDITFTPSADQTGTYRLSYVLDKADGKPSNDSLDKEISVVKGRVPVITDLKADEVTSGSAVLAWSPLNIARPVIEDFEAEKPFVYDSDSDEVAGFRRIDGDGKQVYGPNSEAFTQLPYANAPQSFVVWSEAEMEKVLGFGDKSPYNGVSGDKFLIAFCPGPDEYGRTADADDWLISPRVVGGSSVSFSMKPLTYLYGAETVEILYSTTGDGKEDFKLLQTIRTTVGEGSTVFEEYDIALPEDARYFALHYVSNDVFGIIIDDMGYTPESEEAGVEGFDIYRDGELLAASEACPGNRYADETLSADTDYTYVVIPVMADGTRGARSNTLRIRTTGVGAIAADEAEAEYFTLQGVRLPGRPESGICIRRVGDKVEKITIRKK